MKKITGKARYFKRLDSPHILGHNPSFENNSEFMELPDDFDLKAYQQHMINTKGRPEKDISEFYASNVTDEVKPQVAEEVIEKTFVSPIIADIEIETTPSMEVREVQKPKTVRRGRPPKNRTL